MIGQCPNVQPASLSVIMRGLKPPAPPSLYSGSEVVSLGRVPLLPIAYTPFPAHSPNPLALPEGATPRRREKASWLAPANLFPPALREIGRERCRLHDRAKPKLAACIPLCYCAGAHAAHTPLLAVSGRHSTEICKQPPPLLFGGRLQISVECPPSSSIGWGQGCAPPPHYLSATALMRGKHISPAPPLCLPSVKPIVHLTSIVACGGLRPPRPRSFGVYVPLRAVLRPRRYRLRNVSPALSR